MKTKPTAALIIMPETFRAGCRRTQRTLVFQAGSLCWRYTP